MAISWKARCSNRRQCLSGIVRLHSLGRHREVWGVFLHQRERYQFLEPALVRTALAVKAILSDSGDLNGQIRAIQVQRGSRILPFTAIVRTYQLSMLRATSQANVVSVPSFCQNASRDSEITVTVRPRPFLTACRYRTVERSALSSGDVVVKLIGNDPWQQFVDAIDGMHRRRER
jgi:hypothetical protein